jgi:hypothetical protein
MPHAGLPPIDLLVERSTPLIDRSTLAAMAMGKRRRRAKQTSMWVATEDLPRTAAHPFDTRLNRILDHRQANCAFSIDR